MIKQDDELDKLEENIRKLKNKYDLFFSGIQKMPPQMERHAVEVYIYELGKQKMRENARRFRYNQLLSRYNQYREMWGRKMREREEGPLDFRRRQAALSAPSDEPQTAARNSPAAPRVTSRSADAYVRMTPESNGDAVRDLYNQIESEHRKLGKSPNVTFDQLRSMVEKQSEAVRSRYNVDVVGFRVDVVDGKVKLKAKPIS
ncbi:MAG TPA: MXAN_5187 C-terminal domain-containing protein [Thermoanaerobaculia bacterium]|nr:MXAN_5187 C-terminal domain-containing protein [Thermoanaerobaculia bacterium]